jgi:hypothetical protein
MNQQDIDGNRPGAEPPSPDLSNSAAKAFRTCGDRVRRLAERVARQFLRKWQAEVTFDRKLEHSLNALILVTASAAAIFAFWQLGQATKAAETATRHLVLDQRPWVYFDSVEAVGPLHISDDGATIGVNIVLKAIGNSPAINVNAVVGMSFDKPSDEAMSEICDKSVRTNRKRSGPTLFPGESTPDTFSPWVARADMQSAIGTDRKTIRTAFIFGCVDYNFAFSDELHQTSFRLSMFPAGRRHWSDLGDVPVTIMDLWNSGNRAD